MPIWLRKFTFSKLEKYYEEKTSKKGEESWTSENMKNSAKKESKKINVPNYITKASKK